MEISDLEEEVDLWKQEKRIREKKYHNQYVDTDNIITEETKEIIKTNSFIKEKKFENKRFSEKNFENIIDLYKSKMVLANGNICF
mgnify:CR=1 FL=1